jgi:Cu/Ag efflux pump CusA
MIAFLPLFTMRGVEGAIFSPMSAIGGQAVTQVLEGDRRFDLVVRWLPQYRQSLDAIRRIRVSTPAGASIRFRSSRI